MVVSGEQLSLTEGTNVRRVALLGREVQASLTQGLESTTRLSKFDFAKRITVL